jgi:Kef-type K+ transport system membrane component KefB
MYMIFAYLAGFYVVTNIAGLLIEKLRIPKIYAALFLGVFLSNVSQVAQVLETSTIGTLAQVGMFSLLFLLGYGLDLNKIKKQSRLIFKITTFVIFSEFIVGTSILYFLFNVDFVLAAVISISFATVGEIALLPLLREFKIINSNLGQTILGVAILDDVVEIAAFILMVVFINGLNYSELVMELLPLIAILSGVIFSKLIKNKEKVDKVINTLALWIFGPIFFFTAGAEANLDTLIKNLPTIILFTLAIKATKISSAYLASHKQLGKKKSIVLGVSLGIKFSTSIVILMILLQDGLITQELFSILIGIKVLFKFIVPIVLSFLLSRWQLHLISDDTDVSGT